MYHTPIEFQFKYISSRVGQNQRYSTHLDPSEGKLQEELTKYLFASSKDIIHPLHLGKSVSGARLGGK